MAICGATSLSKIPRFRLHVGYLLSAIVLFLLEIVIANYSTGWVRSYFGDILVIMLIYSALMTVVKLNKQLVVLFTLIFACSIEFSQYFKLAELLGFKQGGVAYTLLGNTFSIEDLGCYLIGGIIILLFETVFVKSTALASSTNRLFTSFRS